MSLFYILLCFSIVDISFGKNADFKTYKDYKLYEIEGSKDGRAKVVKVLTEDYELPVHSINDKSCHILVNQELEPIVEKLSKAEELTSKLLIEDYSKIIEMEKSNMNRGQGFSWTAYHDVDEIYAYLTKTSKDYSNSTQLIVGGKSYEGRDILGLRINTPTAVDKPVFFIESGIHAREWIAPATTTYFINQLLTSTNPELHQLRDQFDWRIFPTVNPDGYHYSFTRDRFWRKTRSKSSNGCYGADPNRNWDYNWMQFGTSNDPCDFQTYGGSQPFSEVETRTLSQYISSISNLTGYVGFHSYAQNLLLPYSDSVEHFDNYDDLKQIGETSLRYGYAVNQAKYDGPGTAAELLYKASGGSMDWVRHTKGTPLVFTYELRGKFFYWPPWFIYMQGDEVTQMMLGLYIEAKNLGYF